MFQRWRSESVSLRHLMVAAGSVAEWASFTPEQWDVRIDDLFEAGRLAGSTYVTLHPHDHDSLHPPIESHLTRRVHVRQTSTVVVDPIVDGRQRICDVVQSLSNERRLTEAKLGKALFAAAGEPDLVVILGAAHTLPTSLVWELAYSELVFLDARWDDLTVDHLRVAIEQYARRQRRFGGVE